MRPIRDEPVCARQWWHREAPSAMLDPEVTIGAEMVGRDPREWHRGGGPRRVDYATPREVFDETEPVYLVESKRAVTTGSLDSALASLLFERELVHRIHGVDYDCIEPVMVFGGADFPAANPPPTVVAYAEIAAELGVRWDVATTRGFVTLAP